MRVVCTRKSDGVVEKVLEGDRLSPDAAAAEPAHWAQFDITVWDESAGPVPEADDSAVNAVARTFTKSAARIDRDAEPARRSQARAALADLDALASGTSSLTQAQAIRLLARVCVHLIKFTDRRIP